jgi:hypothetical protein
MMHSDAVILLIAMTLIVLAIAVFPRQPKPRG